MLQPLWYNVALPVVSCNYLVVEVVDDGMSVAAHISGHLYIGSIMGCLNLEFGYAAVAATSEQ